ncbi:hypothetical protein [Pandoraea anhela]|uniref:Transmembrane protein n=1 Tax=Pandoraea anhela TaxID=2508295 RepID=A0A5E4TWX9_9BURK|nr:hypothetical protein [Pandoraea anhela]VVD91762.1 hypothetical protein PAN31108_01655 [Pandoraea anhela]
MPSPRRPRICRHTCIGLLAACGVALALAIGAVPASASSANAKGSAKAQPKAQPKAPAKLPPFEFAVLGNTPFNNADVPVTRNVLASIGDSDAAFVVHAGNIKSAGESCRDDLVTQRLSLLASSPKPMIYVPGANDWADCERAADGSYNPVERLDFLRDHAFDDDALLGPGPLGYAQFDLTRQSDMARFRQYHENVRWFYRGVVFVGVNLPGNNNNYRSAGGRNGEFEDRVIATRVWLQHALVYAQQKDAIGMVVIAQADPEFEPARTGGLKGIFSDRNGRRGVDGYKDFRTQLQRLAARFKAPILLIDSGKTMHHAQPLHDAHGAPVKTFTQLSTYGSPATNRWVRVLVDPRKAQLFSFESATLPPNGAATSATGSPRPGSNASTTSASNADPSRASPGASASATSPMSATSGIGATPTTSTPTAMPYSALYPASGLSSGALISSDPNQGVMPIGPALLPSASSRGTTHGK